MIGDPGKERDMQEHSMAQRLAAEAFGTAVLVFVGAGSVPALFLARGGTGGAPFTGAELFTIATAFGLAVVAMVYAVGKVSGCHINPAVTFALFVTRRFPAREVLPYWAAQCVGGVLGGLAIWGIFAHKVNAAGVSVLSYASDTSAWSAGLAEALGTGILMFTILGIVDKRSPDMLAGLVIGLIVIGVIITVGPVTGAAINPARYFGTLITGSLANLQTHWDQAWVYVVSDLGGAAVAAFLYDVLATPRKVTRPIQSAVTQPDRQSDGVEVPA
jgi:glycerol uptake facilitator protein